MRENAARKLLSLVMILKDEAASIGATLESVRTAVDHITILDTGSKDGTQNIINEWRAPRASSDLLVQGAIVPFTGIPDRRVIDFAATRNVSLELEARRSDKAIFTLVMSGDEVLHNGAELRAFLEAHRDAPEGAYTITMKKGTTDWPSTRVLRVDAGWRYKYPIHEVPAGPDGSMSGPLIPGVHIDYKPTDPARLVERMRTVDVPVLNFMIDTPCVTHDDHLTRARALLHLAQTHESLALEYKRDEPGSAWVSHQMAAMALYWRRADVAGDPDETHLSLFRYFDVAGKIGFIYSHKEFIARLETLAKMDPHRPEVRYLLAMHASQVDLKAGEKFALAAADVARQAKVTPLKYTTDSRVEWLALQIAAECSKKLEKPAQAKVLAERGVAAGGPSEAFSEYL